MTEPIIRLTKDVSTKQKLIDFINSIPDELINGIYLKESQTAIREYMVNNERINELNHVSTIRIVTSKNIDPFEPMPPC